MNGPRLDRTGRLAGGAQSVEVDLVDTPGTGANGVEFVVEGLRTLGSDRSLSAITRLTTAAALASQPAAVDAALTVRCGGQYRTVAQTSDLPLAVDALQYEHGGPCTDTLLSGRDVVHAEDLRTDTRWPAFTTTALDQTPVLGLLSYRLSIGPHDDDVIGSLNLYATKPHAFDPDAITAGHRLAAYTAVVLAYAEQREKACNLEQALHNSRDIGAAIGILMSRHLLTREQAFERLQTASQHTNRKLRELAEDVIHTGDLSVPVGGPSAGSRPGSDT